MDELLSKISEFFGYWAWWMNEYVFSGLLGFVKALLTLFIKVLEFCIEIIRWIMSFI